LKKEKAKAKYKEIVSELKELDSNIKDLKN
jgi:hypothetical protein